MQPISEQLRQRRKEVGLTLAEVARRAGTSAATISRYESGWDRFEVYTLQKLASALACRLEISLEPLERGAPKPSPEALVERLSRLFWDKELTVCDLEQYPAWVVGRVLEYGALEDVHLLMEFMGRKEFLQTICEVRFSSPRTENFWKRILEREGFECTKKFSRNTATGSWAH
jgi:transcriptional regulator with XRE-family HTH domain